MTHNLRLILSKQIYHTNMSFNKLVFSSISIFVPNLKSASLNLFCLRGIRDRLLKVVSGLSLHLNHCNTFINYAEHPTVYRIVYVTPLSDCKSKGFQRCAHRNSQAAYHEAPSNSGLCKVQSAICNCLTHLY